jgi:hypothetical protein
LKRTLYSPFVEFKRGKPNKREGQLNNGKKRVGGKKIKNKTKNKPKSETKGQTKNKGKKEWKQQ